MAVVPRGFLENVLQKRAIEISNEALNDRIVYDGNRLTKVCKLTVDFSKSLLIL
jgi:hypothetical protein